MDFNAELVWLAGLVDSTEFEGACQRLIGDVKAARATLPAADYPRLAFRLKSLVVGQLIAMRMLLEGMRPQGVATQQASGRGRPATVFRAAGSPPEFPSRDEFPSGGRDGNSDAQLFDFPAVAGASEFPSRIPTPRDGKRDGKSAEAEAEVEF